ncbi:MAG: ABC transporter permease [Muribaculaceae bacterium]|nr:ABC transporter permease [Muribaculaceae bacterium]
MSKIGIVISREYKERVSKKSFIISTILLPLLMIVLMAAPALLMTFTTSESKTIMVVDNSNVIAGSLQNTDEVTYIVTNEPVDSLLADKSIDGVLIIDQDIVNKPSGLSLYTNEASSMNIESNIRSQVESTIEQERLKQYDIENLDQIMKEVKANVTMQTYRNDKEEGNKASSSELSYIVGLLMDMLLYFFLILYGQMVMTSIIEEKNNRVLEIMVSSIKPAQLMLGKIVGIGLVAVTQVLIWAVLMSICSGVLLPALIPADVMNEVTAYSAGTIDITTATNDVDMLHIISVLSNVGYILTLFAYLLLFLVGGFLFYAAMYAAIGSAVDNIQDGGQFQGIILAPVLVGFVLSTSIVADPNSTLATVMSMIPFTSPMIMMSRIPFGIAAWEIVVSLVILYASFFGTVWLAAKIYRVGIFMYGKKPTIKEIIRWVKYK